MKIMYELNEELLQDCINISTGLFYPLTGFMTSLDYHSVVDTMKLSNSQIWTIPISLDIDNYTYHNAIDKSRLYLTHKNKEIGYIEIMDCFTVNIEDDILKIYGTSDHNHPGVKKELKRHKYRIGGEVVITSKYILENSLDPIKVKKIFKDKNWNTIVGFQTRNPVHKAHEHLHRVALEVCDALFINPLVGWKKVGDFSESAVTIGYQTMIDEYYTGLNIHFDTLKTPMRYAGPKEAIFHAIVRRNLGCTHFIIGRDHAGVGDYYGKYEAQELAKTITEEYDIGIELLLLSEPFFCKKCDQIVSEKTCNHGEEYIQKISGTKIREMLSNNQRPDSKFMRPEVSDSIIQLKEKKFIRE